MSAARVARSSCSRRTLAGSLTSRSGGCELGFFLLVEELLVLGGAVQRRRGGLAARDDLRHFVEVTRADFALVLDGGEPLLRRRELLLLQFDERAHVVARVPVRKLEHAVVERMEAGERDELELVAHRAELALEARDRRVIEIALPVERRRAVVGE